MIGNCSGDGSCENIVYTTAKLGNTTAEIRGVFSGSNNISIDNGVISVNATGWDTDASNDYTNVNFNTDYYTITSRYDIINFTADHTSTTHSYIGNCSSANCDIGWGNLTGVPSGLDTDVSDDYSATDFSSDYYDIISRYDTTNFTTDHTSTNHGYIGNCSVSGSCSNIIYTTAKLGNTTTEIFNAVNNGTFVMNNSDATLINLTLADNTGLGMNMWFNGSGICIGTC